MMDTKTTRGLAGLKRRIAVGTRLLCVENSKRPELNGRKRTVVKVQGNGFYWTEDGGDASKRFWTEYPKASLVAWEDADTFRLSLDETGALYVRMRFLRAGEAR